MNISKNITFLDATKSGTAQKYGIANIPNTEQLICMTMLAGKIYEPLCILVQKKLYDGTGVPIRIPINSFFRSPALNKAIGGASNSQHTLGQAIDLDMDYSEHNQSFTNRNLFELIKNTFEFDQLIWEFGTDLQPAWVHVSYREGNNRKQVLKAYSEKNIFGKRSTKYKIFS